MIGKRLKQLLVANSFLMCSLSGVCEDIIPAYQPSPSTIKKSLNQPIGENLLMLATGSFDPLSQRLSFNKVGINNTQSNRYGIVQFYSGKADFHWLNAQGFVVIQNLPQNAYLVNWSSANKALLNKNKNIRWYGAYQTGYKISPQLWAQNRSIQTSYQLVIHTFKDVKTFKLSPLVRKYFKSVKIINSNIPKGFHEYVIETNAKDLDIVLNQLSTIEEIQWLSPYYPQKFYNNEAVSATQAASPPVTTPIFDQGIYGTGQIVGVADSGLDRNEDWFVHLDKGSGVNTAITDAQSTTPPALGTLHPNNKVIAYWVMPNAQAYDHFSASYHGTHVSGSVAGDRELLIGGGVGGSVSSPTSSGYDNDDGMAPNAQILFQDLGSDAGFGGLGSTPMWQQAFAAGVAIHSNSYGASVGNGAYGGSDQRVDQALRELEDMIILFAAGNDGSGANTIGSPANAKNVLTVGALGTNNSSSVASFSSRGPTDDGRIKPDIMATGSSIESAAGDSNNVNSIEPPLRILNSGTSMATPITAGSTALVRQYFMDGFYPTGAKNPADSITPSGPLMKAILLNGTKTDGGFFNNNVGWGRVWLENSLYFSGESKRMRIWEFANANGLQTGEQFSIDVAVQAGSEFRATLVWYDMEAPIGAGITLVNNLDLSVTVAANTYLANNFSGNDSITSGIADTLNTVEQVRFSAPVAGTYTITVDATNIAGNGSFNSDKQGFALVVSGDLASGNSLPPNPIGPSNLLATSNGLAGINLSWNAASSDYNNYEIYRVAGSCANADLTKARYLGSSINANFTDNTTVGGFQYAYKVRAFSDDLISEYSNCIDITSEQLCDLPPSFSLASVEIANSQAALCQVSLTWDAASSNCPAVSDIQYNIYRSSTHGFTPNLSNLIATTPLNATSYTDYTTASGQPYFYVVKAEDTTVNGSGPNNGNQTQVERERSATSLAMGATEGMLVDDVDNLALMKQTSIWSVSNLQKTNGLLSYRSAVEGNASYTPNTCARMYSPTFFIPTTPSGTPNISYQARFNIEYQWDGVVVEISTDGGSTWVDLPPDGGYPDTFAQTQNPPINVCGYSATHGAFTGNSGNVFQPFSHTLTAYQGQTVQIRWSLSTDSGSEDQGFYLDEVQYNNIQVPQACLAGAYIFSNGFEN
jgi:hypothetical protein